MIPLFPISFTVNGMFALGIAWKLFSSYKNKASPIVYYFALFYLYLGLFFLSIGAPLVTKSAFVITLAGIVGYLFLYLAFAYSAYLSLTIFGRHELARLAFGFLGLFGAFFVVLRFVGFELNAVETVGQYVYWRPVYEPWLRAATGLFGALALIIASLLFLTEGIRRSENRIIFVRSLWLAAGMFCLVIAAIVGFIVALYNYFFAVAVGAIFIVGGLFATLRGVLYSERAREEMEQRLQGKL